ncbi:hypothetical protein [Williamsia maris]|uniref:DUF1453 domain-containing protein n=1 Tax=Williamsia maris TaxID=72806 RepID=A0ABT1HD52_9NOCA|nr:hypothetical protein [Williamsia maris]MCP2176183.1 hypothetical protein [Williamsia maris]
MSDLTQAVEISGGIFALMMATQYGTRHFGWHKIALPVLAVSGFGYSYLKDAPTDHSSVMLYLVGAAIGLVFGVLAYASTAMWADRTTGSIMTRCGAAFVAVWLVAMVARIGFVWAVSDIPAFQTWVGEHMMSMHLTTEAIAPFFVIWALTMVAGRLAGLVARSRALRTQFDATRSATVSPVTAPVMTRTAG